MKSVSDLWTPPNGGATNSSGFSGLPGGIRNSGGNYIWMGDYGYFWSSTESSSNAWSLALEYYGTAAASGAAGKEGGFSVRCIRDY